jgi:hypothetical protein
VVSGRGCPRMAGVKCSLAEPIQRPFSNFATGPNRIDIWFGDSDSGSGQHPNFQIELHLGDTVAHRATFIGMTGNPDGRFPDGYNPNEVSGPYCYADVLAMMNALTQAA